MKFILFSIICAATYYSVYSSCTASRQAYCQTLCNGTHIFGHCGSVGVSNETCVCSGFKVSCETDCSLACQDYNWTGGACSGKACRCTGTKAGTFTLQTPWADACEDYDDAECSSNCISRSWRTGWCVEHVCKCTND